MPNLLIAHGGAPTAVINASLYGAICEAKKHSEVTRIYGAVFGSAGILNEQFTDLSSLSETELEKLLYSPASAIGTSRTPLQEPEYKKMSEILKKHDIKYVLFTGGNGSMDTCGKLIKTCEGMDIYVDGIPKTIDNDIAVTDHAPGYGSAVRFVAQSVHEIAQDVRSMPIHVCIVETMGRNAGWITAGAALARKQHGDAPHLIYLPEIPFDENEFLEDVKRLYDKLGGVVVVVSEGLVNRNGEPLAPIVFESDRAKYYGDVSAYLVKLVINKLGIKARNEKPGILGRCSAFTQSKTDRDEAVRMGALAAKTVISKKSGFMAGIKRISTNPYKCEDVLIPIEDVMLKERLMPKEFISVTGNDVTDEFIQWCKPLVGCEMTDFADFKTVAKL